MAGHGRYCGPCALWLIGVPKGEPQSGIDRAYFRMHFDASQQPCKIRRAELIEGDRVIKAAAVCGCGSRGGH